MADPALYNITTGRHPSPFLWFRVAKTGTRTVLNVLRVAGVRFDIEQGFHKPVSRSDYAHHFSFTFVRDPYARLISGWTDKVVNAAPGGALEAVECPERLLDFDQFVAWLSNQDPAAINIHFRPQSLLVPSEVDFIGRTETLARDLRFVLSRIGLQADRTIPRKNASGPPPLTIQDVTRDTRDRINRLYCGDFERFGYAMSD
ncbi:sulfotransferase family protein [Roseicyclus sp.]